MGDGVELIADGGVDFGDAMAVDVAPQRRDAVEVLTSVEIDEEAAVRRAMMSGGSAAYACIGVKGCQTWSRSHCSSSSRVGAFIGERPA